MSRCKVPADLLGLLSVFHERVTELDLEIIPLSLTIESRDDGRKIREKVTGKILALNRALEPMLPPILALLDAPVEDRQWQAFDPPQRRQRTLEAVKLSTPPGSGRNGRRHPSAGPREPLGRRVPRRDEPRFRARIHIQARPHPRGRVREPAPGAAARARRGWSATTSDPTPTGALPDSRRPPEGPGSQPPNTSKGPRNG